MEFLGLAGILFVYHPEDDNEKIRNLNLQIDSLYTLYFATYYIRTAVENLAGPV